MGFEDPLRDGPVAGYAVDVFDDGVGGGAEDGGDERGGAERFDGEVQVGGGFVDAPDYAGRGGAEVEGGVVWERESAAGEEAAVVLCGMQVRGLGPGGGLTFRLWCWERWRRIGSAGLGRRRR